jgi:hypothetical protein
MHKHWTSVDFRNQDPKRLAGLARGARAAIVVPSLIALTLLVIKQPQMAGFAIYGSFAHLVIVNYSQSRATRAAEAATLTLFGAFLVCLGTSTSVMSWTAVAGAVVIGFLSAWPPVVKGNVAVVRTALLLLFILTVAVPTPFYLVIPQLLGWLLAGLVAQPLLQLLWIPILPAPNGGEAISASSNAVTVSPWLGNAASTGLAIGLAVWTAHVLRLNHAFWVVLGVLPVLRSGATSPTRAFWHEQVGTVLGFVLGALLVAILDAQRELYWIALPCVIFMAVFASTAIGFIAGQAAFTVFVVVLFCIVSPSERQVGFTRVEDVAIGGLLCLVVASLQRLGQMMSAAKTAIV